MHTKFGVISDETTPPEKPAAAKPCCHGTECCQSKQAADKLEDHASTRVADAVKDATKR